MGDVDEERQVDLSDEPTFEEKALKALHIVRCQEFTDYDPKKKEFIPTRFWDSNIAFFDLDQESRIDRGPPLHEIPSPKWFRIARTSVNVISLKVLESDEGYPVHVFGTVLARDLVDFRCIYLFRRARDDCQVITSPEDMLTLIDPCRGLAVSDSMYFEINLKIKGDGAVDKDFSRGVIVHDSICHTKQPMTTCLTSWLSTVELVYMPVQLPVEATLTVNLLKGPCKFTRVTAWTTGNNENRTTGNDGSHIILYDSKVTGRPVIRDGGSVALTRRVVAVPLDEKLVLDICFLVGDDKADNVIVTLGQSQEEIVCKKGSCELQVKVAWTVIKRRSMHKMFEPVGRCYLLR